jgi:HSP20 family protein
MSLVRCNTSRELTPFDAEFNQLFHTFWNRAQSPGALEGGFVPPLDVQETPEHFLVTAELPGLEQQDVKVTVVDNALVIRGEKRDAREEKNAEIHRMERRFGRFERVLRLATRVDRNRISASMKDGVLHVQIPKTEEAREREISVEVK